MNFPIPANESGRLSALRALEIIDTGPEESFDRVTRVVSTIFEAPICLISIVDEEREWFKSSCGLSATEMPRDGSFCAHAIMGDEVMTVPDAREDSRFADRSSVTGPPGIRAYAGAPLRSSDGYNLGTLCVIDTKPREFTDDQIRILEDMSQVVVDLIEQRLSKKSLNKEQQFRDGILSSVSAIVYFLDEKGLFQFVNSKWEKWHNRTLQDVQGRHYRDIVRSDQLLQIEPLIKKAYQGEKATANIFLEFLQREVQLSYVPILDTQNSVIGVVGSAVDITRLIAAERELGMREEELEQQADILQTALDSMDHAIAMWDNENQLQAWNPAFQALGNFPDDMMVAGTDIRRFFFHAASEGLLRGRDTRLSRLWDIANTPCKDSAEITELDTGDGKKVSIWSKSRAEGGFVTTFLDITQERAMRHALTGLHDVSLSQNLTTGEKIQRMLQLGLSYFGLDLAIVSHIEDGRYTVEFTHGTGATPDVGTLFPLGDTYCAHTVAAAGPVAIHHARESEVADHPCYQNFALEAYIGCPLLIDGVQYGTVNFSSVEKRDRPFSESDKMIVRLYAQWCGTELLRLQSDQKLQMARDQLTDAVESMPDAFILFDSDENLVLSNSKYADFFPSTAKYLRQGTPLTDLARNLEATFQMKSISAPETQSSGIKNSPEKTESGQIAQAADGRWLHFSERKTGNGGLVGLCSDVTELISTQDELAKARDIAEAANQAKSEFLSSMSHELRTPMNSILGFGQLLQEDPRSPLDKNQGRYVGQILRSGNHLLNLIDEILDLSKIELGNLEINSEVLQLDEIMEECIYTAEALSADKEITIIADTEGAMPPAIHGDRVRVKQALLNLLSNAIKYNRVNGTVTIGWQVLPDQYLQISIADTGRGIPDEYRDRLFQPFSRLPINEDDTEGSGIGLALTKRLVEKMDGRIDFSSVPGSGTKFWVEFPIADVKTTAADSATAEQPSKRETWEADRKVLYIEDNPANLELMQEIIQRIPGLELLSAHTAEIGLTIAGKERPDLVLMDINLPGMDGFAALNALRTNSDTSETPVIALTANAMPADVERGEKAGFQRYLTKPIKISEISTAIRDVLA